MEGFNWLWIALICGSITGILATVTLKKDSFGLIGNIILGILGATPGALQINFLGPSVGGAIIASIFAALAGSALLLFLSVISRKGL